MRSRKEKPIFRGLTIAAAGDLGGGQWSDANISRWVELRKGTFVREMSEDVTHLVCNGDEFRRMEGMVKAALQRPKTCQIVTLDWLEDSMLKSKRLDEKLYSHLEALRRERQRERKRMLVIKGLEKAVREVNPNLYHHYRDHTFFLYEVVLTRDDEAAGIQGERYVLTLHESNNAKPCLYWFVAKFYKKKGDTQAKVHRPSHAPGVFAREFALFQSFFHSKTGILWAERLIRAGTTDKRFFQYQPPTGGKPVGWVPAEHIPSENPVALAPTVERGMHTDARGASQIGVATFNAIADEASRTEDAAERAIVEVAPAVARLTDAPAPQPQLAPQITPAPSPDTCMATVTSSPCHGMVEDTVPSVAASALGQVTPGPSPQMIDLTAGMD